MTEAHIALEISNSQQQKMAETSLKRQHIPTKRMLEFMRRRHHSESDSGHTRLWHCTWQGCDKVFTSGPGLRYHLRSHEDSGSYACLKCNRSFKSSNGLRYHLEKTRCEGYNPSQLTFPSDQPRERSASNPANWHALRFGGTVTQKSESVNSVLHSGANFEWTKPGPLSNPVPDSGQHDWLRELADIATGPQSPLLQERQDNTFRTPDHVQHMGSFLHSYARQPKELSPPPSLVKCTVPTLSSPKKECLESEFESISFNTEPDNEISIDHILTNEEIALHIDVVWMCFLRGTKVQANRHQVHWRYAEDMNFQQVEKSSTAEIELQLSTIEERHMEDADIDALSLRLNFLLISGADSDISASELSCECVPYHPFYVKSKGWASFHPLSTEKMFGISCSDLEVQDLCLCPDHPLADFSANLGSQLSSCELTAADSSAIFALTSMAKQKHDQEMTCKLKLPACPLSSSQKDSPKKPKRPMNAFMLFAKRYRMKYMQLFPGKDNRAISVLLGDKWKKMNAEERRLYVLEAKMLADKQKLLYPDCWKRKRSLSTSVLER